jgi:molybdopterin-guanine dinucleotide biosynthesis protein A
LTERGASSRPGRPEANNAADPIPNVTATLKHNCMEMVRLQYKPEQWVFPEAGRSAPRHPDRVSETQCYHFHVSSAGYLLVGGRSSRMGSNKALLPFGGGALAAHVARAVEAAAGSVTLVGPGEGLPFPAIPDLFPGEGPLGAAVTALRHSGAEWNLIAACDMPELSAEFLSGLIAEARGCGVEALIPLGAEGVPQPLCAMYHRECLAAFEAAFAAGIRSMKEAVKTIRVQWLTPKEFKYFRNVNTPEEWAAYARR